MTSSQPSLASSPPPRLAAPGSRRIEPMTAARRLVLALRPMVAVVAALGALRAWHGAHLPLPGCGFRAITGFPCPFCGGLRTALRLAEGEFGAAFTMNPLVTMAILAAAIGWPLWLAARPSQRGGRDARLLPLGVGLAVLATLANWAYLLAAGGR
jgi:hypothetical protein